MTAGAASQPRGDRVIITTKDGMSVANLIAHRTPEGLKVVRAETGHDTVTITYQLRAGWSWDTVA